MSLVLFCFFHGYAASKGHENATMTNHRNILFYFFFFFFLYIVCAWMCHKTKDCHPIVCQDHATLKSGNKLCITHTQLRYPICPPPPLCSPRLLSRQLLCSHLFEQQLLGLCVFSGEDLESLNPPGSIFFFFPPSGV